MFHVSRGTVDAPAVRAAIIAALARVSAFPHVAGVISPYSPRGAVEISPNRMTAFATINYDKRANLLPNSTGTPLLDSGQVGPRAGPAGRRGRAGGRERGGLQRRSGDEVGVIAALIILLLTFGSLIAAGMPLITAGLGLITGVALIGLATHITSMSNVSPELALMIGLGVGIDYALFIVTRFRENYLAIGDVERSVIEAMDTSGRAILLAGTTVVIALLGMFATGSRVHVRARDRCRARGAAHARRVADAAAGDPVALRRPARASARRSPRTAAGAGGRGCSRATAPARQLPRRHSAWRQWSEIVQARPWPLAIARWR